MKDQVLRPGDAQIYMLIWETGLGNTTHTMKTSKMLAKDAESVREFGKLRLAMHGLNGGNFWSVEQLREIVNRRQDVVVVTKERERVVAFAYAWVNEGSRTAFVLHFHVHERYRNKGVRATLFAELRDLLAKRGVQEFSFLMKMSELEQNRKFFQRNGFNPASIFTLLGGEVRVKPGHEFQLGEEE